MNTPYARAAHFSEPMPSMMDAPHAALLIDFDNVTMGIRDDLAKELKKLLDSDVIKGKVAVQRAYADWRRYPQYIVPLSEASVDLIFAPAYGSSKKNATDIRMAVDGIELVFTRPEIGTFILLTGDSDFSSLVLKLKEYGKYVIGVGIQESSSDILVQNCDEYYSYTSLTGLRKHVDEDREPVDPWVLVKDAVAMMVKREDVMRSDRLKQVMVEIDPTFDEKTFGFKKFSRFLTEAANKGLVQLERQGNGQYEIRAGKRSSSSEESRSSGGSTRRDSTRRGRGGRDSAPTSSGPAEGTPKDFDDALLLLQKAYAELVEDGSDEGVRDSDLKRRMLRIRSGFDEKDLGFKQFSQFLKKAHDLEKLQLQKIEGGGYEVSAVQVAGSGAATDAGPESTSPIASPSTESEAPSKTTREPRTRHVGPTVTTPEAGRSVGVRTGEKRGGLSRFFQKPLEFLEGQLIPGKNQRKQREAESAESEASGSSSDSVRSSDSAPRSSVAPPSTEQAPAPSAPTPTPTVERTSDSGRLDPTNYGLPTDSGAIVRYMAHRYKGVGERTAEALVAAHGTDVFDVLHRNPESIRKTVPGHRADQVIEAWVSDFERREARYRDANEKSGS